MPLIVVGVSHHQGDLSEVAALNPHLPTITARLRGAEELHGSIVLATCNRVEFYLDAPAFHPAVELVCEAVAAAAGDEAAGQLTVAVDENAVQHCFAVASGLHSMVVGESEVAGQVRAALKDAGDHASAPLQRLFQHALETSKTVANRTELGAAGRSIASVGLDIVAARHGGLADRRVLLIGTGAYARVVCAELGRRGCQQIAVHSTTGRAAQFASTHPVAVAADLPGALQRADLVITASGSGVPVLTSDLLRASRQGARRVLPVVDLSLTTDVDPAAGRLPGIDLIDLEAIGEHAPTEAGSAVLTAHDIVRKAVATFQHLETGRAADPAVVAMRSHVMSIIESEALLAARKYPPEVAAAVERSLRRVSNALLHTPSLRAQELARSGSLDDYRRAMHTLFGIEVAGCDGVSVSERAGENVG
ncbi:MAG: glutamyl-tRNA reductase [Candidatus Nanopelagicales bacterium]